MGNINSLNLFDLDELLIFTPKVISKGQMLRLGANIGLHSLVMSKLVLSDCL